MEQNLLPNKDNKDEIIRLHTYYVCHYNPQFLYFLPIFECQKRLFKELFLYNSDLIVSVQERFFLKSAGYSGARTLYIFSIKLCFIYFSDDGLVIKM